MKFNHRLILIIIGAIGLYSIFLMFSDFEIIFEQVKKFRIEYIPIILVLISSNWILLSTRWTLLLRNSNVKITFVEGCKICISGFALAITPGKLGEFIKIQLMKKKFNTPRKTTASIVVVERIYDLVGAVGASFLGIWLIFDLAGYVMIAAGVLLVIFFVTIRSRRIFNRFIKLLNKIKFFRKPLNIISDSYEIIKDSTHGKIVVYSSLLSISVWVLESLGVYLVILSLGIHSINFLQIVPMYSFSMILGFISFIPGGLGVTEGSMAGLLNHYGLEITLALGTAVVIRLFSFWYSVIIGFISLKISGGLSLEKDLK